MSTNETDTTTAEPQPAAENLNRKQPFPRGFLETIPPGRADRQRAAGWSCATSGRGSLPL